MRHDVKSYASLIWNISLESFDVLERCKNGYLLGSAFLGTQVSETLGMQTCIQVCKQAKSSISTSLGIASNSESEDSSLALEITVKSNIIYIYQLLLYSRWESTILEVKVQDFKLLGVY